VAANVSKTLNVQINAAVPTISVTTSGSPSAYGSAVTLIATISSGPTGTVTFYDGSTSIGTATISGTTARITTSSLKAGSHTITAGWSGNSNYGAATSGAVTQMVTSTVGPSITTQPVSQTVIDGTAATFSVAATGVSTIAYQWQYLSHATWKPFGAGTGYDTSRLTTFATTAAFNGLQLRVVVTDGDGNTATSDTVILTVAPSITTQPVSQTVTDGSAAIFNVAAAGVPNLSYQWQYLSHATWKPFGAGTGYDTSTLTTFTTTAAFNGLQLRVVVTDGDGNTATSNAVTLTVNAATPSITWPAPTAITYGTALSSTQLNATSTVAGTFAYSPAAGTVLSAGTHTITATFTPTDTTDYKTATATVGLTVTKAVPSLSWTAPAAITYGTALSATQLNAGSTVAGSFSYSPAAGTVLAAGNHSITTTFTPTDSTDYATATSTVSITVNAATPVITWATPAAIVSGIALSSTQLDATSTVPGTFVYSPAAGAILDLGSQTLSVTFTPTDTTDYTTATQTVTLSVAPASAFVQEGDSFLNSSANSLSVSFPANTSAGDLILVGLVFDTSAMPSSVTDSQGNTFTPVGTTLTSSGGTRSAVYYAKNIKGGAETVTAALSANSGYILGYLTEYSGVDQTHPIDAQVGTSGGTGTVSSGNAATTFAGDVIYGFCAADDMCTAGSGFAARSVFEGNIVEDQTAGTPGNYSATGSANSSWTMQMVALKPALSGYAEAAPTITSATTASGKVGSAFSYQITSNGTPTSYGATGLPAGLSVNTTSGLISGTPTAVGTSTVTLSATNSAGTGNATLTLTIAALPTITSAATASGKVGSAFSYQIAASNTPTSYGATGLPAGLTVNSGTGLISGTPTAAGTSTVTLSAINSAGTGNATLTITIVAVPAITSAATANGTVGSAFSYQITASNTPTGFAATGLPAGLTVNSGTGLISGTPTAAGTSTVTMSASNAGGTGSATLTLTIASAAPVLSINATSVPFGSVALNTPSTQDVTLTSSGTTSVTVNSATVTGTGFTLSSGPTFPVTLTPGQTATLGVEFDPTTAGAATGQLTITSTSSTNGTAVITLSGTGTAGSYAVDLSWEAPTNSTDPVAGYNVYRAPSGSSTYQLLNSSVDGQTTYVDSTVQSGHSYQYIVESVDDSGVESVPTSPITVTIP